MGNKGESVFLGQFEHALDGKNRLFLPARFRHKQKGADFIITQGLEGCLYLYPPTAWHQLSEKLENLSLSNKMEERAFKRMLLSAASDVEVDSQGRILIPTLLKEFAGLQRDAIIIGMMKHVEIWSKDRWIRYQQQAREKFDETSRHLEL